MSYGRQHNNSGDNRYRAPGAASRKNKKSTKWIWITVAVVSCSFLLLCGGGVGALVYFGLGVVSAEVQAELRDEPVIRENIGEIEKFEMNLSKSAGQSDDEVFVFDVEGTKGKGEVTAKIESSAVDGGEDVVWARLRTSEGKTIEIE